MHPNIKKFFIFFNEAALGGIFLIFVGYLVIKTQRFEKLNWPSYEGQPAVIVGWAFVGTGIWFLYFGIRKGIKRLKEKH